MKKYLIGLCAFLMIGIVSKAQQAPETSDQILNTALQLAKKEHKKVLIIFHASWCGWCKKMDASINDTSCKKYFDDQFVIRHITVLETPDKVALDNPGGQELLTKYGGNEQGIPFWLIFDEKGKLVADSKFRKPGESQDQGANIGCPAKQEEVNYFINILRNTTTITDEQAKLVHDRFIKNDVKG